MATNQTRQIRVGEVTLQVSSLDKVLYPETGTTKGDVLQYYLQVAPVLVPQAAWRPATRKRWVDGVGTADHPGQAFFRKDLEDGAPAWVPTASITHQSHANVYPLANDAAVLAWFAQLATLELHVPQWRFGANGVPQHPDRLVIDLDPGPGTGLPECTEVARAVREIFTGMGLAPVPVTSGAKGIHLYVPLDGRTTTQQASELARQLAVSLEQDLPDLVVATQRKALRDGKVLVDWSQNNGAKTTVCPYSLRGRTHPTVAAPRTWDELDDPNLRQLDYREVLERVAADLDPIADQGWGFEQAPGSHDRLTRYRAKRDSARTPEPVPSSVPETPDDTAPPRFVIQEHHARRLHWDFRLEHDGVLVSWAVPKGPPLTHEPHRLAVQTEDHPLAYGSFEGVIPKGEYGGGTVTIWDAGTIEVEKWRADEVIAVLHGRPDGGLGGVPRRYALVRTSGAGEKADWLLILTREQPGTDQTATVHPSDAPTEAASAAAPAAAAAGFPAVVPSPMLATPGRPAELDDGEEWALEVKWDGVRAICLVADGQVRLVSRNGSDVTALYPELAELADAVVADAAILDGEIVALDRAGRPDFSLLQQRINPDPRRAAELRRRVPVTLMLFDVLSLTVDGTERQLLRTPYRTRREVLAAAVTPSDRIRVPSGFDGDLATALAHSRDQGLEGVVAKRLDSVYRPGQRSRQWLKFKHRSHQAVVVIGWRLDDRERLRSLLMAVPGDDGELHYAGRVGSGLPVGRLAEFERKLQRIERKTPPVEDVPATEQRDARWVTPRLVGEVNHAGVTPAGRLRQPAWRGWRPDVGVGEVSWEP
ncbi:MAG: ATP-dependent DNA ligase [Propionicimonas sp.]|uniref:ATP-dependent DNA ligase n=1 Tax=Propionicimonas sp. TaxID=1955623 RepID=UPI002B208734|nr:ATP-dependent DNA ligase [Propionicimonas sp.]MEA4944872.1 ATP-dependent DNA ligase [Propionicimonas sp.]